MAWNRPNTKSLQASGSPQIKAALGVGAPVSINPGTTGRPYTDGWSIERAYSEGMRRVTWVARAIDAIAGNQARLPVVLRKDNSPSGEIVKGEHELTTLLNTKANIGENSFVFRYRISAQLLISTRGVFIEKVRGRGGKLIALQLLPPQNTAPIPDAKTFVSGFHVQIPGMEAKIVKPDDVIWIRRPHPLDPYLSLTPMEAAGVAVEIETLAKLYNRNFLINDGRPGGIVVVEGEMDETDKAELRSRYGGNINRAGRTSVLSGAGVSYVDTAANPRDAAYIQMREITKEEILTAFGVPESALGNASGRTFSNAAEELRVFWMETMLPHLTTLGRGLDEADDRHFVDFDTSGVPILILAKQEQEKHMMDEYDRGLRSNNEYRVDTGKKRVDSDLANALLANPNLTPIGNTERKFDINEQAGVSQGPPVEGEPQNAAPEAGVPDNVLQFPVEPSPAEAAALLDGPLQSKAAMSSDRWVEILDHTMQRLYERQARVVSEKALGAKSTKALSRRTLSPEAIFDKPVWDRQFEDDVRPMLTTILEDAAEIVEGKIDPAAASDLLDRKVAEGKQVNDTLSRHVSAAVFTACAADPGESTSLLKVGLDSAFAYMQEERRKTVEKLARSTFNEALALARS